MNCIIVDDEPLARKGLRRYLEQLDFIDEILECRNAMELEMHLKKKDWDLIFLDIAMPLISGIDFLRERKIKPFVIITSAYQEYALESYQLDVTDYLVKPFSFERFLQAVQKVHYFHKLKSNYQENIERETGSYIYVKSDKRLQKIMLNDILYAESMQNYTRIYTRKEKILSLILLKKFIESLPANRFVRIHKSYVVALDKIEAIDPKKVVVNGQELNIGKAYKEALMKKINQNRII